MENDKISGFPAIIKPTREYISEAKMGLTGRFEVELIHKPTGLLKQQLKFDNLITNAGLDDLGNGTSGGLRWLRSGWIAVGSGSTPPQVTDTQLQAIVGSHSNTAGPNNGAVAYGANYSWMEYTNQKVFPAGTSTGMLTEVGVWGAYPTFFGFSGPTTMLTRQLFKDEFGNPTTIDKQVDDELRVTYKLRMYYMSQSRTETATIRGIPTTITTRGYRLDAGEGSWPDGLGKLGDYSVVGGTNANVAFASSTMPGFTNDQTGTAIQAAAVGWNNYTNGNFYRDMNLVWNPASNIPNIGSIVWGGYFFVSGFGNFSVFSSPWITTFSPAITKSEFERVIFTGRFSWGRG